MNERIKYLYKSILLSGVQVTYGDECGKEKFIIILNHKDKQESLRIPK